MLPRLSVLSRSLLTRSHNLQAVRKSSDFKSTLQIAREARATYNDLPTPSGAWKANFDKRNSKWNMYLAVTGTLFVVTVGAMVQTGTLSWHGAPNYKNVKFDVNAPVE